MMDESLPLQSVAASESAQCPRRSSSILSVLGYSDEQIEAIRSANRRETVTLLDPDEINVSSDTLAPSDRDIAERQAACQSFRHSGWSHGRALTAASLRRVGSANRLERFEKCGSTAWVLKASSGETRYRLATNRCRDRFCLPCYRESARVVLSNLRSALAGKVIRFLTLTLRSSPDPLNFLLDRSIAAFRKLRHMKPIKHALKGGIYFFEVTRNPKTGLWHPHLHVLFEGGYIPQPLLKSLWLKATGDSFIVDIRGFNNSDRAVGYCAKYVSKGIGCGISPESDCFDEVVQAFTGRRLFSTFGTMRGIKLSAVPEDLEQWEPVAPLWKLLADAAAGSRSASAILAQLRRLDSPPPSDLVFATDSG